VVCTSYTPLHVFLVRDEMHPCDMDMDRAAVAPGHDGDVPHAAMPHTARAPPRHARNSVHNGGGPCVRHTTLTRGEVHAMPRGAP